MLRSTRNSRFSVPLGAEQGPPPSPVGSAFGRTEVRSQHQSDWIKEGFNSMSVGGSLGGGQATVPVSVEASWEKEHAYSNQSRTASDVQSLAVTYNFPRAVVELHPDGLEMTEQARRDGMGVTTQAAADRFNQEYGSVFVKDRTRIAVGLSFKTEYASGGIQFAKVNTTTTTNTAGSLLQDSTLTWDAVGGDTLLCTKPPPLHGHGALEPVGEPTAPITTSGSTWNLVTDVYFNTYVRVAIMDAFGDLPSLTRSAIARKMSDCYDVETLSRVSKANIFNTTNFPDEPNVIPGAKLFSALTLERKVG
ncbi:hypothetical protein B0T18DRAFT_427131 [Schizothecium vesticola]|uniref:Uncharacterized protein n=1 Tax=Schizothecium vesticola TaxID=314040 RepID=A0AA40F0I0_9PEZI|nr:hypothetical protein B0T18DRAFT_427131 [Schizothecium vesticola]